LIIKATKIILENKKKNKIKKTLFFYFLTFCDGSL
jgi:hypothetical protein